MAGLMDSLMTQMGMMAPAAQEMQKTDEFGVALPPEPGQQVGPPQQPSGMQQHMGQMMGGQPPQMDPNMIQMLMQMILGGQGQSAMPPQGPGQGMPPQMPPQMPPGGRGF